MIMVKDAKLNIVFKKIQEGLGKKNKKKTNYKPKNHVFFFWHHLSLRIQPPPSKLHVSSPEDAWHGTVAGCAEQVTLRMLMTMLMTEKAAFGLSESISRSSCHHWTWETTFSLKSLKKSDKTEITGTCAMQRTGPFL